MLCLQVFLFVTIMFCSCVQATELSGKGTLIGLSQSQAHEKLGEPWRTEEFFPFSKHCTLVEYYKQETGTNKYLRVTYDASGKISASDIQESPHAIPKFMGEKSEKVGLTFDRLTEVLKESTEEDFRKLSVAQVEEKLGVPGHIWHETSRNGGRNWHFLNYLYFLSTNGQRAFVIMFNEDNHSVYEYRFQTLSQ